jgi:hypothetical protein
MSTSLAPRQINGRLARLAPWVVPIAVAGLILVSRGRFLPQLIAGVLGLVLVALAARRPDRSILVLIVVLPFQALLLSWLYARGIPAPVLKGLSAWKEALGLGVVIAGVRGFVARRQRLDRLDLIGFAFVAVVGAYAIVPHLFAPAAPTGSDVRWLAFRQDAGFVILLLAARHAALPEGFTRRAARLVMGVGAVIAAIAVYEFFFSASWNRFVVETVQYPNYQFFVTNVTPFNFLDIRQYAVIGGRQVERVGSVLLSPLTLGFYLLLPFAVALQRTIRDGLRSAAGAALILTGAGLLLTQTRAALVGAVVVALVTLRRSAGQSERRRLQFGAVLAAAVIIALPAAASTGLTSRAATTASGEGQNTTDHVDAFWTGLRTVADHPMGLGIGTSAGVGQRFQVQGTTITENYYEQMGIEVGVIGMVLFVALTLLLLRRLGRATLAISDLGVGAVRTAAWGLVVGAFFLHAWTDFATAWTFWALAGAAIGMGDRDLVARAQREPPSVMPNNLMARENPVY